MTFKENFSNILIFFFEVILYSQKRLSNYARTGVMFVTVDKRRKAACSPREAATLNAVRTGVTNTARTGVMFVTVGKRRKAACSPREVATLNGARQGAITTTPARA